MLTQQSRTARQALPVVETYTQIEDIQQRDLRFQQLVLYFISGSVLILLVILTLYLLRVAGSNFPLLGFGFIVAAAGVVVLSFLLARTMHIRAAAYILVYASLLVLCPSIINGGSSLSIDVFLVGTLITAGILLKPRDMLIAGVSCCLVFALSWVSLMNAWFPALNQAPTGNAITIINGMLVGVQLVLGCVQIYLFVRHKNALVLSAQSQAAQLRDANTAILSRRTIEQQSSQEIDRLATILSNLYRDQEHVAQRQAELVSEVAATSQEMDRTTRAIAGNAQAVADAASSAVQSVEQGQTAVAQGVESFTTIGRRVEQITERVRTLSGQVTRISEVTAIIGDIADETNLLAVNATIEAAGAREYGRRFAAVADEVQRLASRATQAVEEVQEMITEVTEASRASLNATEDGLREVAQGTGQVERLREVNNQIEHGAVETAVLARSIAQATQQQQQASEEIVSTLLDIDATTVQVSSVNAEVGQLIAALHAASRQLSAITDDLPAPGPAPAPSPVRASASPQARSAMAART